MPPGPCHDVVGGSEGLTAGAIRKLGEDVAAFVANIRVVLHRAILFQLSEIPDCFSMLRMVPVGTSFLG